MSTSGGTMIIGKIPGYNSKTIVNANGIAYTDRLLTNLTIAEFSPVGYTINLAGGWGGDLSSITNKIYRLGPEVSSMQDLNSSLNASDSSTLNSIGQYLSTYTALMQWQNMQKFSGETTIRDTFKLICTNDSSITESLSNSYDHNMIDKMADSLRNSDGMFGSLARKSANAFALGASLDTNAALSMLSSVNRFGAGNQLLNLVAGKVVGVQSAFPKIWRDSNYNNTSSFTIKLVSPSGHPDDIERFLIQPLKHIILAASPVTFDGIAYGFPPLWKVQAKGLVNMKLAAITSLSISRGGQDTVFNYQNQPTNIDIRIVVEPIVQGFATPILDGIDDAPDQYQAVKMLVQNPNAIVNPMRNLAIQDAAIELRPLNLS